MRRSSKASSVSLTYRDAAPSEKVVCLACERRMADLRKLLPFGSSICPACGVTDAIRYSVCYGAESRGVIDRLDAMLRSCWLRVGAHFHYVCRRCYHSWTTASLLTDCP